MIAYKQIKPRLTTALTGMQKYNRVYTIHWVMALIVSHLDLSPVNSQSLSTETPHLDCPTTAHRKFLHVRRGGGAAISWRSFNAILPSRVVEVPFPVDDFLWTCRPPSRLITVGDQSSGGIPLFPRSNNTIQLRTLRLLRQRHIWQKTENALVLAILVEHHLVTCLPRCVPHGGPWSLLLWQP